VLLKYFNMPNRVVVLPAPVGPVTRTMPYGSSRAALSRSRSSGRNPRLSSSKAA
jgi:hypothetical protein